MDNVQKYHEKFNLLKEIISGIFLVVISIFYVFTFGSYFEIDIFPLEDGSVFHQSFDSYIIDRFSDWIVLGVSTILWSFFSLVGRLRIALCVVFVLLLMASLVSSNNALFAIVSLVSLPIVFSLVIANKLAQKKFIKISSNMSFTIFSLTAIGIGILGFVISSIEIFATPSFKISNYSYDIFILISSISPALMVFLIFGAPIKLAIMNVFRKQKDHPHSYTILQKKLEPRIVIPYLLLFMLLAGVMVLLPHNPSTNPDNVLVGADSADYFRYIKNLKDTENVDIISNAFVVQNFGDRPIALLFVMAVVEAFPAYPSFIIDHIPIILAPVLVLSTFFLTRELCSNDSTALFASFLTAISYHTLIGIYGGFYANWLALIFGFFSLTFFLKYLKKPTKQNYVIFLIFIILLLFSHVYTWTILTMFMLIFLGIIYKLRFFEKKAIAFLFIAIIFSVAVDIGKSTLTESVGGVEQDISIAKTKSGIENFALIEKNLAEVFYVFGGGSFSNFLILILCAYWLLRSNFRDKQNIFIASFFSLGVLPILFGNDIIQTRVLYDISFQIPAAMALTLLSNRNNGSLMIIGICIWLLASSIRTVANFV